MMLTDGVDFEKTFIQCIVYNYEALKEYGDESEIKAKGKIMTKGKDYVVDDGSVSLRYCENTHLGILLKLRQ